ncbi:PDZ and LIM domain protein Zasp [Lamellibrachia satsuma]|nr:PDZ and LIM domain protein Zasp [Lamellibrachia satsuma]
MSCAIKLRRLNTSTPWGFRMNGGAEYGQPLYIQKVTQNSMAAKAGLQPGDGILAIGMSETANMSHNQAKMEIIRAGNDVDFIIQRNVVPVKSADDVDAGPQCPVKVIQDASAATCSRIGCSCSYKSHDLPSTVSSEVTQKSKVPAAVQEANTDKQKT